MVNSFYIGIILDRHNHKAASRVHAHRSMDNDILAYICRQKKSTLAVLFFIFRQINGTYRSKYWKFGARG